MVLPFGGIRHSGCGREPLGLGIKEFVNQKLIGVVYQRPLASRRSRVHVGHVELHQSRPQAVTVYRDCHSR
jgi:hypothetical protein